MSERLKRVLKDLVMQSQPAIAALSPSSGFFVSLNVMGPAVQHYRRHRPLTRQTAKVLIRVSVGMFLALLLLFLVVYTVILIYVDKHFNPPLLKSPNSYKKLKLKGRLAAAISPKNVGYYEVLPLSNEALAILNDGTFGANGDIFDANGHRKQVWNPSKYYTVNETLPQCRYQTLFRILISSAPEHFERRQAIRGTWCDPSNFSEVSEKAWRCVFLVGQTQNSNHSSLLKAEKARHQDVLLGNYLDTYRNLTLKVIPGIAWSVNHCPCSYLLKTDDDCFVNAGLLYHTFLQNKKSHATGLFVGNLVSERSRLKVMRSLRNRWAVSYKDYPGKYYPPYASGMGYILSTDVAQQLVTESNFVQPFSVDDAYVGIIMSRLPVTLTDSKRFQLTASGLSLCNYRYVFVVHEVEWEEQQLLSEKSREARSKCKPSTSGWS
ncbi:beta-1,3-galactosyltransferase 1-like [Elysia marginata]|uniref:Hexosyltransferase n=1 Tax=Elysia marginata TaxID=1093978 RepID=A0AAV4G4M0_9GAST|nr:beta-1,3-galactosyltransferase 1-like [Elysia marginata]